MPNLHVVAFDLPFPPDYGGAIDVYYKLKALHDIGIKINLHVFLYGDKRGIDPNHTPLADFCHRIYSYPRLSFWQSQTIRYPYLVGSRRHPDLWHNLTANAYPVLFEGLHTCAYLPYLARAGRQCMVRMHNIEADYYRHLYQKTTHLGKKLYYGIESYCLQNYEPVLRHAQQIWAISPPDTDYLQKHYGKTHYLPAFHAHQQVVSPLGKGHFALYHGNLQVRENELAALFLLHDVFAAFAPLPLPLVIAGKKPSLKLQRAAAMLGANLIANPNALQMQQLIAEAQVHLLPTFQPTGIKLKLLDSLFCGRFCIANTFMVAQTGLQNLCLVADSPAEFAEALRRVTNMPFGEAERQQRQAQLTEQFANKRGAEMIRAALT